MAFYEELGRRIAEKRLEKGYSQTDLAKLLNISQTLLAKIETGKRNIQVETLAAIARILDTDCDYLITGTKTEHLTAEQYGLSNDAADVLRTCNQACVDEDEEYSLEEQQAVDCAVALLNGVNLLITSMAGREFLTEIENYIVADFNKCYGVHDISDDELRRIKLDRILIGTPPGYPYAKVPVNCLENAYLQELSNLLRKMKQEVIPNAPQK